MCFYGHFCLRIIPWKPQEDGQVRREKSYIQSIVLTSVVSTVKTDNNGKKAQLISVLRVFTFIFWGFFSAWAPGFVSCALYRVLHPTCFVVFFSVGEVLCLQENAVVLSNWEESSREVLMYGIYHCYFNLWTENGLCFEIEFLTVFTTQQNGLVKVGMGKRRRSPSVCRDFLGL